MESYRIIDIEYQEFRYQRNWFDKYIMNTLQCGWWNYGYNKEKIFAWSIGLFIIFSLINLSLYPKLKEGVYPIAFLEVREATSITKKGRLHYIMETFTFTAFIFFGLKMDVDRFKEGVLKQNPLLFVYLMLIYVLGLGCLGFVVNIILAH